jgi:hypothetical protein
LVRRERGLDFAITADLIDTGRVNIFERWESQAAVETFRSSGPSNEEGAAMLSASVAEYDIADVQPVRITRSSHQGGPPPLRSTRACNLAMRSFFSERAPSDAWWHRLGVLSGGSVAARPAGSTAPGVNLPGVV